MKKLTRQNLIRILIYFIAIVLISAVLWIIVLFFGPLGKKNNETGDLIIHWGESFTSVANNLEARGIIASSKNLYLVSRIMGNTLDIKAGKYTLPLNSSNYSVMQTITGGQQSFIKVTIPEGLTAKRISALISDTLQLDPQKFSSLITDTTFIHGLHIAYPINPSLEGYLYPETYNFTWGSNEKQVITQLVNQFFKNVTDSLIEQGKYYHFDLNDMITLASIIEGEAVIESEMPIISSVYHNRLKQGMLLQADPTIQYIIPDGPRRILNRDLEMESPYNTYIHPGLPPGPINNPGYKAICAAVFPDTTDFLYFVADGKGGHIFSRTLSEHNQAKKEFNKIRRQVAREKRMGGVK